MPKSHSKEKRNFEFRLNTIIRDIERSFGFFFFYSFYKNEKCDKNWVRLFRLEELAHLKQLHT